MTIKMIHTLQSWFLYLMYIFNAYCSMCSSVATSLSRKLLTRSRKSPF